MAPFWVRTGAILQPAASARPQRLCPVKVARRQLAEAVGVNPERLVFTSGATEANNLAPLGHARALGGI